MAEISKEAIKLGFNELQYDYFRFPVDCSASDIVYPIWDRKKTRREVIIEFSQTLTNEVKAYNAEVPLSVAVFGYAVLRNYKERANKDTGQYYEDLVNVFDIISPMVYPSHYDTYAWGIPVPATEPYLVVYHGLKELKEYLEKHPSRTKIRPWLQYFSLSNYKTTVRVEYNEKMIWQQRKALIDLGIDGFLYWDPANKYNRGAIKRF